MPRFSPRIRLATHEVANQPPDYVGHDLFNEDLALRDGVLREGNETLLGPLTSLGREAGGETMRSWAVQANRFPPELRVFDRWGRRIDEVEFHPAYHQLLDCAHRHRFAAVGWDGKPGSHLAHAVRLAVFSQVEQGTMCPVSMTYAAAAVLRRAGPAGAPWVERIEASVYEPALMPLADKYGVTVGMALTEKQGGSDLRGTKTRAEPDGAGRHRLWGHKWFCSAPMSDAFLTLAQSPGGLSCFLVPRLTPDGERNAIQLMRLKDKLGNRSNASAEIEYHGAEATLIGEEGRGIATVIAMAHHTRLDTMACTLGIMRAGLAEAAHHCAHRFAFGRRLAEQPLMRATLAGLQLEYEAAVALTCRVARAFDANDAQARSFARLGVALGKLSLTRRAPGFVAACLECLGGNGYVEESALPRLYREAPVNAIWEGSGHVIALDVVRTLSRDPDAAAAFWSDVRPSLGLDPRFDSAVRELQDRLQGEVLEVDASWIARRMAAILSAALLLRILPAPVAREAAAPVWDGTLVEGAPLPVNVQSRLLERLGF